ncbi:Peroxidase superfamily protein isoform 1 [Hibiscus syriacus]|uniref:Peroxidase superfamily protein isoform 1 n=1 Tax=Hibiscus syriacus TaxID=106335 RepID=A0A6A2X2R9_HIBSY|nr:Peroxidase superfamily protein isoform 1 [Hibiscus syriacus]
MSQGFSTELYFDSALENQVLKAWNVLARRQISTQLIEIESRPHVTLFSSPFLDPARLESVVKSFVSKQEPLPLSFSSIGTFPNEKNILFLAPTPTMALVTVSIMMNPFIWPSKEDKPKPKVSLVAYMLWDPQLTVFHPTTAANTLLMEMYSNSME